MISEFASVDSRRLAEGREEFVILQKEILRLPPER
jgi:hypothetical protein